MKVKKTKARNRKVFPIILLIVMGILVFYGVASQTGTAFSLRAETEQIEPGGEFRLQIHLTPGMESIGAFLTELAYDDSVFELETVEKSAQMEGSDLSMLPLENCLRLLYTCDVSKGTAPRLSGKLLTLVFHVREDAPEGGYSFSLNVEQVCDFDGKPIELQTSSASAEVAVALPQSSSSETSEPDESPAPPQLTELQPSTGTLSPAFDPEQMQYELTVPASCDQVHFSVAPQNAQILTEISRTNLNAAGSDTLITITVKFADNSSLKTEYTVVVHRESSEEETPEPAQLLQLSVHTPSGVELTPDFSPEVLQYDMTVASDISEVAFDYEATPGAAVVVSRRTLESAGSDTVITLTVSNAEGTKTVYRIIVHRQLSDKPDDSTEDPPKLLALAVHTPSDAALTPAFSPDVQQYEVSVSADVSQMTFDYEAESGVAVDVSRYTLEPAGSDTVITLTASDAEGAKTEYRVIVHRLPPEETESKPEEDENTPEPKLLALSVHSPADTTFTPDFSPDVQQYEVKVPADVSEMTFDYEAESGVAVDVSRYTLEPAGSDTVITLTASDAEGAKTEYRIIVHRALSDDEGGETAQGPQIHSLSIHSPAGTALTPAFSPDVQQYTASVPSDISAVTFDYTADSGVAVDISRSTLESAGSDTAITITAADADGAKTAYRVVVHRALSDDNQEKSAQGPRLYSLKIHSPAGTALTPAFSPNVQQYTASVPSDVSEVTFDYTADSGVAVDISRYTLQNAGSDTAITLTAENAAGAETEYRVVVHRQLPEASAQSSASAPKILSLSPIGATLSPAFSPDVFEYETTVSSATKELNFQYQVDKGLAVSINRSSLKEAGDTEILLVVSNAAGNKTTYRVIVHRLLEGVDANSAEDTSSTGESSTSRVPSIITEDDDTPVDQDSFVWIFLIFAILSVVVIFFFGYRKKNPPTDNDHQNQDPPSQQP